MNYLKKNIGIPLCIVFVVIFDVISYALKPYFYGTGWYLISSLQRFIFFAIELFIFIKLFKKFNICRDNVLARYINSIVDEGDLSADCRWKGLSF